MARCIRIDDPGNMSIDLRSACRSCPPTLGASTQGMEERTLKCLPYLLTSSSQDWYSLCVPELSNTAVHLGSPHSHSVLLSHLHVGVPAANVVTSGPISNRTLLHHGSLVPCPAPSTPSLQTLLRGRGTRGTIRQLWLLGAGRCTTPAGQTCAGNE